ncbi:prepilin-type N-terminal cleavage/methylation domain-containing protein [Acinetobacter sp. PK01]|uniref:prepilin-type N-terminal cleavage/methylation domain-containing protein n=1 Tax=Acinetobacter sp. PK01 TaxID=2930198 RepID=UPI001FB73D02|nr:prepilin-type N-terminal cleavage/methylation domain-containing protein [Acinetobacter sp. PK01]UOG19384.1 prepilin-type N-terminal cleavage/methylation domain-containing protein [Acinetobacter sp. PK01]
MKYHQYASSRGFTLIEVMVVIVVVAIVTSLIMMNFGGIDQRKAMQAREIFMMNLQRIAREANDQSLVLALNVQPATDVNPFRYTVVEYHPAQTEVNMVENQPTWTEYSAFKIQSLPEDVSFQIQSTDYQYDKAQNSTLLDAKAPQLIWLGNGEVKPVRIQFYFAQQPIGSEIEIDHLGKMNEI